MTSGRDRSGTANGARRPGRIGGDGMAAIGSPLRLDLLQTFRSGESLSVAELAARLGRQKETLYYHVRLLVAAGILVETGRRRSGRRYEALYTPVAERIVVAVDPSVPLEAQDSIPILGSSLRLAEREYIHAIKHLFKADRTYEFPVARRLRARLTDSEVALISRSLNAIERVMTKGKSSREGRLFSMTTVFVPVEDRGGPDSNE